jgi:hypothetical protein
MSDGHGKNQQDSHETDNTMASVDPDAQRVVGACSEGIYYSTHYNC